MSWEHVVSWNNANSNDGPICLFVYVIKEFWHIYFYKLFNFVKWGQSDIPQRSYQFKPVLNNTENLHVFKPQTWFRLLHCSPLQQRAAHI